MYTHVTLINKAIKLFISTNYDDMSYTVLTTLYYVRLPFPCRRGSRI